MKALVGFLAIIAGATGFLIKVPVNPISAPTLAPSGWIHLQKLILPLFENVCEESNNPTIIRLSQEFASNPSAGDFLSSDVITPFLNLKSGKGFLPKGEIFSDYNDTHIEELKVVYDVMYNAKNFDSFYKVAAWARQNLNCGLYVNLIYLALETRRDTEKLTLPPPYELLPNYFIRKDIIIQGSSLLAGEEFTPSEGVRDEGNAYTLDANYTANFYDNDEESKLAYFREDIGLNSYFFLKMMKHAPYLNENVDINSRYGEELYYMLKQLVARYDLERYSNGMPEQDGLSWESAFDEPYDPMLVYSNGNEFIHRSASLQLPENADKSLLQTIENNIATVVSHMRESGYNKTQILNHLMEILVTGKKSYDTLARHLLGSALSNNGQPTIFDHYMTSLRDPMVWKLYKKIVDLIDNSLKILPPYTKSELYFPGVEVINIDVKKMTTSFDYFEFDITEALNIGNGDTTFQVKIGQTRLNHKPFTMKMNISSLVTQKGLVKVYLGPKIMPGEFTKKKNAFVLLDFFEINLKKGSNIVTRSSSDMKQFSPDFLSLKDLKKRVEDAQFGLDSLPMNVINSQINFPERLAVPKGTPEGLPLQLFVFVAPYMKTTFSSAYTIANMEFNSAILSPLYPLDLTMEDKILLALPNALVKDIVVTQKGSSKPNTNGGAEDGKSWSGKSSYGPPKPNAYSNGYDYNSKGYDKFANQESNYVLQNDAPHYLQASAPKKNTFKYKESIDHKFKSEDDSMPGKDKINEKSSDYIKDIEPNPDVSILNSAISQIPNRFEDPDSFMNNEMDQNMNDYNLKNKNVSPIVLQHNLLKSSFDKKSFSKNEIADNVSKRVDSNFYINKNVDKNIVTPIKMDGKKKITEDFIIIKDKAATMPSDVANEDIQKVDNVEIYKIYKNKSNLNSSKAFPSDKFAEIIVKDVQGDDDYIGVYKDDSNEEFIKIVPTSIPDVQQDTKNNIYKYIMRIINNHLSDDEKTMPENVD